MHRGIEITGSVVGLGYIGTMCDKRLSVAYSQDGGRSLAAIGATAAHELGHNFNMVHDEGISFSLACSLMIVS